MQTQSTCPECGGTGKTIDNPCPDCEGQGRMPDRQHVTVEIPHGIHDGQQLRLQGYGEAGMHGARAGDLIVTVRVDNHERFNRDGNDLHALVDISMVQAALGATIELDGIMPNEKVAIDIPAGCQTDQVIRVRNFGLPVFNRDNRGDFYAHSHVTIPKKLNKRQIELLEEWATEFDVPVGDGKRKVGQRIKDALS
jgi:molecular chaperone DnaJ